MSYNYLILVLNYTQGMSLPLTDYMNVDSLRIAQKWRLSNEMQLSVFLIEANLKKNCLETSYLIKFNYSGCCIDTTK